MEEKEDGNNGMREEGEMRNGKRNIGKKEEEQKIDGRRIGEGRWERNRRKI